jgi:pimeloyl-ACP methyl ester carboxylesterase
MVTDSGWSALAPRPRWERGAVEVHGGRLAFWRTGGAKPQILLSHGFTDNGLCWSRLALALEDDFDLILIDARGHGESSRVDLDAGFDPADDLARVCIALDLNRPTAIGHSVGARATLELAARHPGLVSRVVLEDPPLGPPTDAATHAARRDRIAADIRDLQRLGDDDIRRRGEAATPDWPVEEFIAWTAAKRQVDPVSLPWFESPWQAALEKVAVPVLLLRGEAERGSMVSDAAAIDASRINALVEARVIPGAGHNLRRENFDAYLASVMRFLR